MIVQNERRQIVNRLRRIEGQVKGIVKMIEEEEHSCSEVLMQVAAVRAAINSVGTVIFETHFRQCLENAVNEEKNPEFVEEIMSMLGKYIK
jgi:CsoR family transcriptional regulator, copper-sensing transcriptional repressor